VTAGHHGFPPVLARIWHGHGTAAGIATLALVGLCSLADRDLITPAG